MHIHSSRDTQQFRLVKTLLTRIHGLQLERTKRSRCFAWLLGDSDREIDISLGDIAVHLIARSHSWRTVGVVLGTAWKHMASSYKRVVYFSSIRSNRPLCALRRPRHSSCTGAVTSLHIPDFRRTVQVLCFITCIIDIKLFHYNAKSPEKHGQMRRYNLQF